jgi:hypothetical protein
MEGSEAVQEIALPPRRNRRRRRRKKHLHQRLWASWRRFAWRRAVTTAFLVAVVVVLAAAASIHFALRPAPAIEDTQ